MRYSRTVFFYKLRPLRVGDLEKKIMVGIFHFNFFIGELFLINMSNNSTKWRFSSLNHQNLDFLASFTLFMCSYSYVCKNSFYVSRLIWKSQIQVAFCSKTNKSF
jgi:hypothetical protein